RLLCGTAAHVDLVGDVTAGARSDLDDRHALLRCALARRTQARERKTHPLAGSADHLGLVAADRRDRPAHAEVGSLDGIALAERHGQRQRPGEIGARALRATRAIGRRAKRAVLIGLALAATR